MNFYLASFTLEWYIDIVGTFVSLSLMNSHYKPHLSLLSGFVMHLKLPFRICIFGALECFIGQS